MTAPAQITHWIDSSKNRNQFWARTNELGLDNKEVLATLGVDSVHDYAGTFKEAMDLIEQAAVKKSAPGWPPDEPGSRPVEAPPEEPAQDFPPEDEEFEPDPPQREVDDEQENLFEYSRYLPVPPVWFATEFIDQDGFKWKASIQAGVPTVVLRTAMNSALTVVDIFRKGAKANSWMPAANGNGRYIDPATATVQQSESAPAGNNEPVCPYHGQMKRSKHFEGWYCPSKMGDGTYCKETVKN